MKGLKYLLILIAGCLVAIMGTVAGLVSQIWIPIPISLLSLGFILILIGLFLTVPSNRQFWQKRSFTVTTNTILTSTAFIVILAMLNFLVLRNEIRIDLTENQIFTLSPQTQALVNSLTQPTKVWVFASPPHPMDRELLKNYRRYNSEFTFEFVDPELKPQLARQFELKSPGEVYLEYQDQRQLVQKVSQAERLSEAKLTNAIVTIQRDRPTTTIYFLAGHGEPDLNDPNNVLAGAVNNLENLGYLVKSLNLAKVDAIPTDANVLVLFSPKKELPEGEVETLRKYLTEAGRLLLLLEPQTDPGLDKLLEDWGIQLDERLVIDASGGGSLVGFGPATIIVTEYGDHPITANFGNNLSLFHLARPISTNSRENIEAVALAISDEQTWAESKLDGEEVEFNEGEDIPGPLDLGVALSQNESRLVIFGNTSFVSNGWLEQQLNSDLFLNTITWLVNENNEAILSIRPKEPRNRRLNLTLVQTTTLGWLALVVVPLLGFFTAAIAWWRRR